MLYLIKHDEQPEPGYHSRYKYSDGLFDYVYSKLKYVGTGHEGFTSAAEIDLVKTRKDHQDNGCRIWYKDGTYETFYECDFLFELTDKEAKELRVYNDPTLEDIVDYYHKINNIDGSIPYVEPVKHPNTGGLNYEYPTTKMNFKINVTDKAFMIGDKLDK